MKFPGMKIMGEAAFFDVETTITKTVILRSRGFFSRCWDLSSLNCLLKTSYEILKPELC